MSYRGIDAHPKLTEMTGQLNDLGALFWNIKLGSIEKESVDMLVSETLVSRSKDCFRRFCVLMNVILLSHISISIPTFTSVSACLLH